MPHVVDEDVVEQSVVVRVRQVDAVGIVRDVVADDCVVARAGDVYAHTVPDGRVVRYRVVRGEAELDCHGGVVYVKALHEPVGAVSEDDLGGVRWCSSPNDVLPVVDGVPVDGVGRVDGVAVPVLEEIVVHVDAVPRHDIVDDRGVRRVRDVYGYVVGVQEEAIVSDGAVPGV